jgi:hypothetical protein
MKMREIMQLTDPCLVSTLFYSTNALSKTLAERPEQLLVRSLSLQKDPNQTGINCSQGALNDAVSVVMESCVAHDTLMLRLSLSLIEPNASDYWQRLHEAWAMLQHDHLSGASEVKPWGLTRLFHASLVGRGSSSGLIDAQQALQALLNETLTSIAPDPTSYGWLWLVKEGWDGLEGGHRFWKRDLLLLTPEDRSEKVRAYFIQNFVSGLSRIELYLHKSKHHARQYEGISANLNRAMMTLQNEMAGHLGGLDFSKIYREPVELERISQYLMRFLGQKAAVEITLNSLRNNLIDFQEHLDLVKLDNPLYELEKNKLARQIEQIESDLKNAQVIQDSTYALQDIQRAAEGSRFEHASYLLGVTAALLAGISLFNSFLDIWSLTLENSGWQLPASWLRILLSLIASVAIPLGAIYLVGRKKIHAVGMLLVSLLSVAAMVLSTILINL